MQLKDKERMTGRVGGLENEMKQIKYRLENVEKRLDRMEDKLDKLADKIDSSNKYTQILTATVAGALIAIVISLLIK